jgi:hypothetical protein
VRALLNQIRQHINTRRQELVAVALFAGFVGLLSVAEYLGGAFDGDGVESSRIALALLGIAGATLAWIRPGGRFAWMLLTFWAVIQTPVIAWSPDGSPTEQFVRLPLTISEYSERKIASDAVSVEYSEYGINLVAVVLTIVLFKWREAIERGRRAVILAEG